MGKISCYEEGIEELNGLLIHCPQLKPIACKKIEKVVKELVFKIKVNDELAELKAKELFIKEKIHLKHEETELKIHKELEEITKKKIYCESQLHADADEFKAKVELLGKEISPEEKFKGGFLKFKAHFEEEKEYYQKLAEFHKPKYLIFSCCDSRVDPCKILDLELGEAVVVRNLANFVTPYGEEGPCPSIGAALEYAVLLLKVEHILIVGHSRCEGIAALVNPKHEELHLGESIQKWLKIGEHSSKKIKETSGKSSIEEKCELCEKESVNHSLHNCLTYPFIKEAVVKEKLHLHAGYYDFLKGGFDRWGLHYKVSEAEKYA